MSGGHFQHAQYHISAIADTIETVLENNNSTERDCYGDKIGWGFAPEIIAEFRNAVRALRLAHVYAQRVDWLLSCDDGPESFKRRLNEDLMALLRDAV